MGDRGSIHGSRSSPGEENGNSLQYSCLDNPVDRGAWRAIVHGVAVRYDWATNTFFTREKAPGWLKSCLVSAKGGSDRSPDTKRGTSRPAGPWRLLYVLEAEPIEQILTQPVGCQLTEISHVVAILVSFASQPEVLLPGSSGARGLPLEPGAFESKRAFFRFFSIVTVGLIASKVFPTFLERLPHGKFWKRAQLQSFVC